jgi:hypothetical protein
MKAHTGGVWFRRVELRSILAVEPVLYILTDLGTENGN